MDQLTKRLLYTGLALTFVGVFLLQYPLIEPVEGPEDEMVALINKERQKVDVLSVRENGKLDESATNKACDIIDNDYWAHVRPDGKTPWEFFREAGYEYTYAGENLCRDNNVEVCMQNFMGSEKHRDNILDPYYNEVGIGICGDVIVQHFGSK